MSKIERESHEYLIYVGWLLSNFSADIVEWPASFLLLCYLSGEFLRAVVPTHLFQDHMQS
ncbi:hypothetical protein CIPAW_15G126600 [Carya illinoinensis]|uniref:Uncharacterized protein n=1 Tax=Carya illinoinensis TaxID=32201 RepID=A0A8T1NBV3_CARIL|nr:hypothetical protein CIPAW_15G126600 [Carya illinoinensis]